MISKKEINKLMQKQKHELTQSEKHVVFQVKLNNLIDNLKKKGF